MFIHMERELPGEIITVELDGEDWIFICRL